MSDEPTTRPNDGAPAGGPGERLQAARIERGIALEDLANQMHLSVRILESLENNRFEEITAPIFVKGYLRSYARIVDLNETEILDLYVSGYMDSDPPISTTSQPGAPRARHRKPRRWGLWLALLLVLAVLAFWWYQRSLQKAETISLDAASEPVPGSALADDGTGREPPDDLAGQAAWELEQLAPEPSPAGIIKTPVDGAVLLSQDGPADADHPPLAEAPVTMGDESTEAPVSTEVSPSESVTEPAATDTPVETPSAAAEGAAASPADKPLLELRVTADTWADIRDASGRKQVYNLLRAGRSIRLDEVEAPLTLFFGNGHGVKLNWRGRRVDLSDKIRADNTVRITLE